jgi:aspartate kinase
MRVVMKFGGGILADAACYARVAEVVKQKVTEPWGGDEFVAVVSAAKGVTDRLIAAAKDAPRNKAGVAPFLAQLEAEHREMLSQVQSAEHRAAAEEHLDRKFERVQQAMLEIADAGTMSPADEDFVDSYGERLSNVVLCAYLRDRDLQSEALDAEDIGMVTNGRFGNALPILPQVRRNLKQLVEPGVEDGLIPVITGYYGTNVRGEVTTFGRGGSDYSAAILAACLDADALEVWKDVEGFMTANPKVVGEDKARKIDRLAYDEAEELSYFGAEILHPRTIDPLRQQRIKCIVKDIRNPEASGTIISEESNQFASVIKSLAVKRGVAMLTVRGERPADAPGFAADVFQAMADAQVSIDAIATSQMDISFTINSGHLSKACEALAKMEQEYVREWYYEDGLALVGVVGIGMRGTPGVVWRVFKAVGTATPPINVEMIFQGGSEINISFVVKQDRVEECLKVVHAELFEGDGR